MSELIHEIADDFPEFADKLAAMKDADAGFAEKVAEYERLNDEAAASPIVEDHNVLGWFAGVAYRF